MAVFNLTARHLIISVYLTVIIIFSSCHRSAVECSNLSAPKADSLIKIEIIAPKVVLIHLGYDAVTAIETAQGIVVIDAGISKTLTVKYRKIIEKHFKRNDFVYLINTHAHSDHTGGNQVFEDIKIIGQENAASEMLEEWKDLPKRRSQLLKIIRDYEKETDSLKYQSKDWEEACCQKLRYGFAYYDLLGSRSITLPTLKFMDSLELDMGDITISLLWFGKAHSESDILIHIPEQKLLMTGDLFFQGGKASININPSEKDKEQWKKAAIWLQQRIKSIDKIISGHGKIMTKNDLISFIANIKKL